MIENINPNEYYSLRQIIKNEYLPWIKSLPTLSKWISSVDTNGQPYLKSIIRGEGAGKRYYVKGSDIIQIINLSLEGNLQWKQN